MGRRMNPGCNLSISMVLYRQDRSTLRKTFSTLAESLALAGVSGARVKLVDNSPEPPNGLERLASEYQPQIRPHITWGHGNIGFGRGHNMAFDDLGYYHLVINPDIELAPDGISAALEFMDSHPDCGLLTPAACDSSGQRQFLAKRHASLFNLMLRGFAPPYLRKRFRNRLEHYEMRDLIGDEVIWDPPLVSGCFMLFRSEVLQRLGGFDPRYFLYFEDFDLSLRAAGTTRIAFVPSVRIIHHGGRAADKGFKHIYLFSRSAITFFNTHGWRLY
jgi:GT2 family glycosyltransferase